MKIIGIISSPHLNGSSAKLLREALKGAKEAGAEVEEIYLPDYNIEYCSGCLNCLTYDSCSLSDDANYLREKLLQAEGIILSSPTYGFTYNARMKNFFDRICPYIMYRSALRNKYVVGIATAGASGAKETAKKITEINEGFHKIGYVSGTLGACVGWGDVTKYLPKAYGLGRKIVNDIQDYRKYPFQKFSKKLLFALIVKPTLEKIILENKNDKRKAVYEYLKNEGLIKA